MANEKQAPHRWQFFRSGGFDQVALAKGADLLDLGKLDPTLWAALACPSRGLEMDPRTLELMDTDDDGRIRVPEVVAATQWAASLLKDPDELLRPSDQLPLESIDGSTPEGAEVLASARQILADLGRPDATTISVEDTADTARIFAQTHFNGDGIVPPASAPDDATRLVMEDIIGCVGAETDRSGKPGVSQAKVDDFFAAAGAYSDWWAAAEADAGNVLPFGDATEDTVALFESLKPKIDDFYTRQRLAAFDPRAEAALNPAVEQYQALAAKSLSPSLGDIAELPIAAVGVGRDLPLTKGVNPAWSGALQRLRETVIVPLIGTRDALTEADWADVCERFAAHARWLSAKQGDVVEKLGVERVREILASDAQHTIAELIARDLALEGAAGAITKVERLVHLRRDLACFLNNFVSFRDFYTGGRAVFQAGTLYLDGRRCDLCIRVDNPDKHAALANRSRTYLAYCECTRRGSTEKMHIAAAFTDGDAENLMVGRNGVFYDRQGDDWDATVVKTIEHPISIREAFWSPYKRIGRMIGDQIEKMASAKAKAMEDKTSGGITGTAAKVESGTPPAPAAPFDVAKFAGIFAAIGLAVGAIGTALASVVTGFMGLRWWQMPLAAFGLLLVVSGPSMVIAYMKLRTRTLAPILDANGWAVNTHAMINIPFGASLTHLATLPAGAQRSLRDPFAEKRRPWKLYLFLLVLAAALATAWHQGLLQSAWDAVEQATPSPAEVAPAPAAPAPATAAPAPAAK